MAEQLLLKFQRNDVFNIFKDLRINPEGFQWIKENSKFTSNIVNKLVNKQFGYYFQFDIYSGSRRSIYYPTIEATKFTGTANDWVDQLSHVMAWAQVVKIELDFPDLWEVSLNASRIFEPNADRNITNDLFTIGEQEFISSKLIEIENYLIENQTFSSDDIASLKERISYLEESSKRLGKKDWLNIIIGTAFRITIDLALSSEIAKNFFGLVGTAFGHFLSGPVLIP